MMFQKFRQKSALKRIEPYRGLDGWLTDQEALGLFEISSILGKNLTIVEIGSWQGKSTFCLARGLQSGTVYAIDPFNGDAGMDPDSLGKYLKKMGDKDLSVIFEQNMRNLGVLDKIRMMKGYSTDFHEQFSKIDVLFIDGDHSVAGCTTDFNLYAHKVVPGGFIAFHDYYADRPGLGPTHVIQQMVMPGKIFEFYKQFDSLWIGKRLKGDR